MVQGAESQPGLHRVPTKNDPALHINQLHMPRAASPPNYILREKEREFKALYNGFMRTQEDLKQTRRKILKRQEKESKLNDRISALEKTIAELRYQLKTKSDLLETLTATLDKKVEYYEGKLKEVDLENSAMKTELKGARDEIAIKQEKIDAIIEEYEKKLRDLQNEHEEKMKEMQETHDEDIKNREEKLTKLKQRMSETIGKNSAERQQQLEELKKDLVKSAQEARELHKQLKYLQLKPKKCDNCVTLEAQLDEKILQLRLKEKTINDLQNIGKSMQLQLNQQHKTIIDRDKRSEEVHVAMCIRAGIKPNLRKAASSPCAKSSSIQTDKRRWTSSANIRARSKTLY